MMNEGCEEKDSLVRVRAQVMTRDDSSGGWVPMDGGGLSNVSVRKRVLHNHHHHTVVTTSVACNNNPASRNSSTSGPGPPPTGIINTNNHPLMCHCGNNIIQQHEFLILGKRISDQTVVLSCTIRKDFQYNKVMPTFHHWRTGDQKFGLTFQTAADARAFDKGVRMAVEDLLDAFLILPGFRRGLADLTPALHHMNSDVSEDDVFMTLDLPMERSELQQTSSPTSNNQNTATTNVTTTSTAVLPITATPPLLSKEPHLHRIHFMQRRPLPPSSSTSSLPLLNNSFEGDNKEQSISPEQLMWQQRDQELALARERERAAKEKERQRRERENSIWSGVVGLNDHIELDKESYSYVQFAREGGGIELHSLHEYSYPVMPDPAASKPSSQGTTTTSISTTLTTPSARRDSLSSLKKNTIPSVSSCNTTSSMSTAPMLPSKSGRGNNKKKRRGSNSSASSTKMTISHLHTPVGAKGTGRQLCKHCEDTYQPEDNRRGACNFAPDNVRSAIDAVSCVGCAQCLLYHCYADAEGDFAPHPCGCGGGSDVVVRRNQQQHHQGCCMDSSPKRWFGLALLSLVVPCLWCYLPLRACYRCGVQCGCCGKPHEPA